MSSQLHLGNNHADGVMTSCLLALETFSDVAKDIVAYSRAGGGSSGRKSGLHIAFRDLLKVEWFPTYANLVQSLPADKENARQTQVKNAWIQLGEVVGLDLEREYTELKRDARRKETCCAWKDCQWHRVPPPSPPRVCKGCGEVRYCSKECQTK